MHRASQKCKYPIVIYEIVNRPFQKPAITERMLYASIVLCHAQHVNAQHIPRFCESRDKPRWIAAVAFTAMLVVLVVTKSFREWTIHEKYQITLKRPSFRLEYAITSRYHECDIYLFRRTPFFVYVRRDRETIGDVLERTVGGPPRNTPGRSISRIENSIART